MEQTCRQPAIFLDKDGTLVENLPYNVDCEKIRFTVGAIAALRQFHASGYLLTVVTNQSGMAKGLFSREEFCRVEREMTRRLADEGIPLAGFYTCPHFPEGNVARYSTTCRCRKPRPGLILRAAKDLRIDLSRSWMIGDILDDIEAGHRAGCRAVLLNVGSETIWQLSPLRRPDAVVPSLTAAAECILSAGKANVSDNHIPVESLP